MPESLTKKAPDVRTLTLGHYILKATGLTVTGLPSFEEHEDVGQFIQRSVRASGFWLADWLRYGEGREDWHERIEQAHHLTGLSEKTCKNVRAIGAIPVERRNENVEFCLHDAVTALAADEQVFWLARAETEGWTLRELRQEIRAAKRTKVIEGQAVLAGQYRVILADCPWIYGDSGPTADGSLGKAERHFTGMTIEELCKLPVAAHERKDSILFFWVTATMLYENPGPREVIEAWGFKPKTGRVWDKVLGNPGHYATHVTHEHLIIATRGSCLPDVPTPQDKSILVERRGAEHSGKPESLRAWIMKHWTAGPYLELFGRHRVEGWDVFGNDARLWAKEASA